MLRQSRLKQEFLIHLHVSVNKCGSLHTISWHAERQMIESKWCCQKPNSFLSGLNTKDSSIRLIFPAEEAASFVLYRWSKNRLKKGYFWFWSVRRYRLIPSFQIHPLIFSKIPRAFADEYWDCEGAAVCRITTATTHYSFFSGLHIFFVLLIFTSSIRLKHLLGSWAN